MDSASFIASLAAELRTEILLIADEPFLNSLVSQIEECCPSPFDQLRSHAHTLYHCQLIG